MTNSLKTEASSKYVDSEDANNKYIIYPLIKFIGKYQIFRINY